MAMNFSVNSLIIGARVGIINKNPGCLIIKSAEIDQELKFKKIWKNSIFLVNFSD